MSRAIRFLLALVLAAPLAAQMPPQPKNETEDLDQKKCDNRVTGSLNPTPATIKQGRQATLGWSVVLPTDCTAVGEITLNSAPVALEGSITVAPLATQRYALKLGTRTLATTHVNVELPKIVRIKGNSGEWRALLLQALVTPDTTVLLADGVDMDMTGFSGIRIQRGVTLTSEARPLGNTTSVAAAAPSVLVDDAFSAIRVARTPQNPGPRLYTRDRPADYLFLLDGDNIRLQGFRLQGPDLGLTDGMARGIEISSKVGIDISNMEISGWSLAAIYVTDPEHRILNPDAVKIHDNFIHHNQHVPDGPGYGIDVVSAAYARIERNVFDFNRHAIAAGGQDGTGYLADRNLVLRGGGTHCIDLPVLPDFCGHTHMFDVHGSDNCGIRGLVSDSQWNCGRAGQQFWVTNNAFQYRDDNAFKLRGTPSIAAYVNNNVFAHRCIGDIDPDLGCVGDAAVHQNETGLKIGKGALANTVNVDTYGQYGVCDFDGDGKDDLFLATGASWWYSSAGRGHWSFLNSHTERLHQVGLGDFDGDGRCDVFTVHGNKWEISSGGTRPWTSLPGIHDIPFEELRFHDFDGDGITDVFRRAPNGQWHAFSSGSSAPRALQSSGFPLSALRFGDFNGDRVTDVLSLAGDAWSVSLSATSPWQRWNGKLSDDLPSLLIANVDGVPGDDIVRYVPTGPISGKWEVSSGGRGPWKTLATLNWPTSLVIRGPARGVLSFVGRFDVWNGADLLAVDFTRMSRIYSAGHANFAAHSLYAY